MVRLCIGSLPVDTVVVMTHPYFQHIVQIIPQLVVEGCMKAVHTIIGQGSLLENYGSVIINFCKDMNQTWNSDDELKVCSDYRQGDWSSMKGKVNYSNQWHISTK